MSPPETAVAIRSVRKTFGSFVALEQVTLDVFAGEFFTLLGPSGCGKTTLLRLIAGFEHPTSGDLELFGDAIAALPPHKRPINTVFQHYALFPHLNVAQNVAFGLEMLGQSKRERTEAVGRALELVQMSGFAERKPAQLSGGQQQRVALARALAPNPKVLLLDEPLSALDLKLRHAMRGELKTLQRETGVTFIFVTHDQEEALTMSDRIAVMSQGRVRQVGTPAEIYETPVDRFVADFVGRTNFFEATVTSLTPPHATLTLPGGGVLEVPAETLQAGAQVTLFIRPEKIMLRCAETGADAGGDLGGKSLGGTVLDSMYLGTDTSYRIGLPGGGELEVRDQNALSGSARFALGDKVLLDIAPSAARFLLA